jgi:hypothetical protein
MDKNWKSKRIEETEKEKIIYWLIYIDWIQEILQEKRKLNRSSK